MPDNGNGQENIENTIVEIASNDSKLKTIYDDDMQNLYKTPEHTDIPHTLITPGKDGDIVALLMKGDIPNNALLAGLVGLYQQAEAHNSDRYKLYVKMVIAGLMGKNAKRAQLVSDTITGERHNRTQNTGGFIDRFFKKAPPNPGE